MKQVQVRRLAIAVAMLMCSLLANAQQQPTFQQVLEAAQHGDATACHIVGWYYFTGDGGVSVNMAEAFKWYKKAAELGEASAYAGLAFMYEST